MDSDDNIHVKANHMVRKPNAHARGVIYDFSRPEYRRWHGLSQMQNDQLKPSDKSGSDIMLIRSSVLLNTKL